MSLGFWGSGIIGWRGLSDLSPKDSQKHPHPSLGPVPSSEDAGRWHFAAWAPSLRPGVEQPIRFGLRV